jgi:hypothetical protein
MRRFLMPLLLLWSTTACAAAFSCPEGLTAKEGRVPHPWFDDIPIPSKWCVDDAGVKNGPWWGWDPETGTVVFRVETVAGDPHGLFRMYYTDGTIAEEGRMERGRRVGKWTVYRSDGSVESETAN